MSDFNAWWLRQFERHLHYELAGRDPKLLSARWLALDAMIWRRGDSNVSVNIPHEITHFLDDADIRSKDKAYAIRQWSQAKEWVDFCSQT